jgi:GTPase SAR1 family protein
MFFRGALGALIVFDLTREQTFIDREKWLKDLKTSSPGALSILVGNKNDLEDMRVISREEAEKFAKDNNCISYIETSAKSGINVADAFNTIGERLLNRKLDELS